MNELDDAKLVVLVQATRDPRAFEILVRRHQPALVAFLRALGADDGLVEDAAQRALLKAYDKIAQFESRSSFKTWLFTIACREHGQLVRKKRSEPSMTSWDEAFAGTDDAVGAHRVEHRLDLEIALAGLSPPERTAVLLCDAYGFSNSEAATAMNKPLGTIKTYVRRARAVLRQRLGAAEKDGDHV
ncbi:MAG: sigma-70 family RNA polymerase sigma factor [Myxococcota bacterium]